jgi:phenylacetic acid degradation operon negative regulatory protein
LRAEPSRTWSLIITLYGDAVVPRGGALWLGTLLEIFAALDIGGNVVRTAMSRLASDGWLERTRSGRNSFYRLADKGRLAFAEAADRIYRAHSPDWDGVFRLAVLDGADREASRGALEAAGYAPLAPGILIAASPAAALPATALPAFIALRAETDSDSAARLARQVWPAEALESGYGRFVATFAPMRAMFAKGQSLSDLDALVARMLLIHEYRRLVLRDPPLPDALRPANWIGHRARALCAQLYASLFAGAERWLDEHGLNDNGRLPPPAAAIRERFGGIG